MKGTIHWVSAPHAHSAPNCGSTITCSKPNIQTKFPLSLWERAGVRGPWTLAESVPVPSSTTSTHTRWKSISRCKARAVARRSGAGRAHFQFERLGYFFTDPVDSQAGQSGVQPQRRRFETRGRRKRRRNKPPLPERILEHFIRPAIAHQAICTYLLPLHLKCSSCNANWEPVVFVHTFACSRTVLADRTMHFP